MREVRFSIWRLLPPFRKRVTVRRISVGGFLDLVRAIAPKAAKAITDGKKKPFTDIDLIRSCSDADNVSLFADLVCVGQPVAFMSAWLDGRLCGAFARRNTERLLAACRAVEGDGQWTRFLGSLTVPASRPSTGRGGLMADVMDMARFFGLPPTGVLSWPLQEFLNLCDGINATIKREAVSDPTMDPDAEASDVAIPGLWQVH